MGGGIIALRLGNLVSRTRALYRDVGVAGLSARLVGRAQQALGIGHRAAWLRDKRAADAAFDATLGTDTGGVQHAHALTVVGDNGAHATPHIAADPADFTAVLDALDIEAASFAFVDLGSGKGRALMLAARYPFRTITGVEFAAELHAAAETNIATLGKAAERITLINGDAADFALPAGPVLLYLYHPFGSVVMRQVAARAMASWRADPRPIVLLYFNPVHGADWSEAGWHRIGGDRRHARYSAMG